MGVQKVVYRQRLREEGARGTDCLGKELQTLEDEKPMRSIEEIVTSPRRSRGKTGRIGDKHEK